MQLLDMVFACPSWCNDGVARRFGVGGHFLAQFVLGIWYIFLYDLVFGVIVVGVWVFFLLYRALDFREMTWSLVAMLSSTVDTYSALYWAGS